MMRRCCIWKSASPIGRFRIFSGRSRSRAARRLPTTTWVPRSICAPVRRGRHEFQTAIRLDPGYANPHTNLGNVWLAQQKYDEAIREFTEVVHLQPDSAAAKSNLAAAKAAAAQPR